jgi:fido (protein-threonine AMPylation protein)
LLRRRPTVTQLLDDKYLRELHKAMLNQVWKWAGRYRRTEANIGIEPDQIPVEVRSLADDAEHPLIRSYEPNEDWWWCYPDALMFEIEGAPPSPSHP